MEESVYLNVNVNSKVYKDAEKVLSKLGISMTEAIEIYLKQISLMDVIPFNTSLEEAPASINADQMSKEEIIIHLEKGINDVYEERTQNALEAFERFKTIE